MATYLKIYSPQPGQPEHAILGDVSATGHRHWLDVQSLTWGGTADDSEDDEDGKKPSKMQDPPSGLTITRRSGPGSCGILDWFARGDVYNMQIECCQDVQEPFLWIRLELVRVISYASKFEDDKNPTETIEVIFQSMTVVTNVHDKTGQGVEDPERAIDPEIAKRVGKTSAGDRLSREIPIELEDDDLGDIDPDLVREDRTLVLDEIGGNAFELSAFAGTEQVSVPFSFWLDVQSEEQYLKGSDLIGKPASFRIIDDKLIAEGHEAPPREFHGIVREVIAGPRGADSRKYTLFVVPELWFLSKRTDCRIFQEKTVPEIVEEVFELYGFKFEGDLMEDYPKLPYCVQYRETDLDFVHRLLEGAGIFYTFRFSKGAHQLVLADHNGAYETCSPSKYSLDDSRAGHLREWRRRSRQVSGSARFRDYFHETSADPLEVVQPINDDIVPLSNLTKYELYDYPGLYREKPVGNSIAELRMQAEEARYEQFEGASTCDPFRAGSKFKIKKFKKPENVDCETEGGSEFMLVRVRHRASDIGNEIKHRIYYKNDFRCIPADKIRFRPPLLTKRPRIEGPQTALVVGTGKEQIDVDKYLSVKVKFRWDRAKNSDENSSCWIRVAQPISGSNWGAVTIPRVGQEVVVEFLEGNPDRPLITGSLYNNVNLPPYGLPAAKTQTVFKTRSTPEGEGTHFNELRFEDKKGAEHIYFHAEKDFERVVEHNDSLIVGEPPENVPEKTPGAQTIHIETDRTATILNNDRLVVGQPPDEEPEKTAGAQTLHVQTDRTATILNNDRLVVGQPPQNEPKKTAGAQTIHVETDRSTIILKSDHLIVGELPERDAPEKAGAQFVDIKTDRVTTIHEGSDTVDAKKSIELKVGENFIKIDTEAIELKFGKNSVKLDNSGITIKGMEIKLDGETNIDVKAGVNCTIEGSTNAQFKGGATCKVEGGASLDLKGAVTKIN